MASSITYVLRTVWNATELSTESLGEMIASLRARPEPIILLSNAPKFFLLCYNYAPRCTQLCSIMLNKSLLPESED